MMSLMKQYPTKGCDDMKKLIASVLVLVCMLSSVSCGKQQNIPATETRSAYTYEELSEMPAEELLDLFIQNGLVINDDLKEAYTEEELQTLFQEHFDMWRTGLSALSHTMYIDLAEQTKAIYDKIAE